MTDDRTRSAGSARPATDDECHREDSRTGRPASVGRRRLGRPASVGLRRLGRPASVGRRRLGRTVHVGRRGLLRAAGAAAVGALAGCSAADEPTPDGLASLDGRDWERTWSDEFETLDTGTWTFEEGNGHAQGIPGWGNGELQYYSRDNATVEDGRLVIEAREEAARDEYGSYDYTSARLKTQGSRTVKYGRVDVRAKLPTGQGVWPAIWSLGSSIGEVGWPACGELDVMELVGDEPATVHGTVHGPGYSGADGIGGAYELAEGSFAAEFHVFSVTWDPDRIRWFVDAERFAEVTRTDVETAGDEWVFDDAPFFLVLNVAVGGAWPGPPDDSTSFPQRMAVDYVRLFEEA